MRILVTGADGFVGRHLVELLKEDEGNVIIGLDRQQADITDLQAVKRFIGESHPDRIYHLAGFASGAGKDKDLIFNVNVNGTLNIIKALENKPARMLITSTAYVYGHTAVCADENAPTDAKSFYDQSKLAMEGEVKNSLYSGLEVVITRATNHIGPGQNKGFVVPDFCSQIVGAKDGDTILVGDLSARRDLFDVRDCVKGYKLLMEKGMNGETYNIGRGQPVVISEVLNRLIELSGKKLAYQIDPARMRPSDIPQNCVIANKIRALGWQPEISLVESLRDTYQYFVEKEGRK